MLASSLLSHLGKFCQLYLQDTSRIGLLRHTSTYLDPNHLHNLIFFLVLLLLAFLQFILKSEASDILQTCQIAFLLQWLLTSARVKASSYSDTRPYAIRSSLISGRSWTNITQIIYSNCNDRWYYTSVALKSTAMPSIYWALNVYQVPALSSLCIGFYSSLTLSVEFYC